MGADKLRAIRDQIERGDEVIVTGHGHVPRKARVIEVLRAAVRITYLDKAGESQTVMFKQITRVEEETRTSVPPPPMVVPTRARVVVMPPTNDPPQPPPSAAAPVKSDYAAWLEMGRDMRERWRIEAEMHVDRAQRLRADAKQLETEAAAAELEAEELQRQIRAVTEITEQGKGKSHD